MPQKSCSDLDELRIAIATDDFAKITRTAQQNPGLLEEARQRPLLAAARSVESAQRLLDLGFKVDAVSNGWEGGIGVRRVDPGVARFLMERGARPSVHAASALGLIDILESLLLADPALIHAKGTDACTPLHFARDIPTAQLLVSFGARIEARDEDHDSTPAQWLIGDAPEVSRWLLDHGATADIFLASALGDRPMAEKLIAANPSCLSQWIGRGADFPPLGHNGRGGTIYQWTLGFNCFPHQIALENGHTALFEFLFAASGAVTQFLVCCLLARCEQARSILSKHPGLIASLEEIDLELPARYCWETNLNYEAIRLMLDLGFPVAHPEHTHGFTPLHNSSWAGAADLVELLLQRGHPVELKDPRYNSTALGWALHDCLKEKRHPEGDFVRVVQLLIDAGCPSDGIEFPTGHDAIDRILEPKFSTNR